MLQSLVCIETSIRFQTWCMELLTKQVNLSLQWEGRNIHNVTTWAPNHAANAAPLIVHMQHTHKTACQFFHTCSKIPVTSHPPSTLLSWLKSQTDGSESCRCKLVWQHPDNDFTQHWCSQHKVKTCSYQNQATQFKTMFTSRFQTDPGWCNQNIIGSNSGEASHGFVVEFPLPGYTVSWCTRFASWTALLRCPFPFPVSVNYLHQKANIKNLCWYYAADWYWNIHRSVTLQFDIPAK